MTSPRVGAEGAHEVTLLLSDRVSGRRTGRVDDIDGYVLANRDAPGAAGAD